MATYIPNCVLARQIHLEPLVLAILQTGCTGKETRYDEIGAGHYRWEGIGIIAPTPPVQLSHTDTRTTLEIGVDFH